MNDSSKIKNRLREALATRDMTGAELARRCNINKGTMSRYLRGDIIPKQSTIFRISQALGVSPAWLLGFDLNPDGSPLIELDISLLTETNRELLLGYYKALIDSQGAANSGNTKI